MLMNSRIIIIAIAAILLLILLFIGVAYLLSRLFAPERVEVISPTPTPISVVLPPAVSPTEVPLPSPTSVPTPTNLPTPTPASISVIIPTQPPVAAPATVKILQRSGYILFFPGNWGLLTCNNSPNFELDPDNSIDQQITCDFAQKPITALVRSTATGCSGETIVLGQNSAVHSISQTTDFTVHRWCTLTQPVLDITHRVSPFFLSITSTVDHSAEIEEMIANTRFTNI